MAIIAPLWGTFLYLFNDVSCQILGGQYYVVLIINYTLTIINFCKFGP